MADYTLTGYTGAALEAQLAKINTQGAKLDTIEQGANNYTLPQATRSQLGGIIAYATVTTMPLWYGRVYVNSQTGMPYIPLATDNYAGALSPNDYGKLKLIWPDCTNVINKVEKIKVDGTALTPDENKAVNIDLSGKVDNGSDYMNVSHSALWCMTYVLGDHTGAEHPFLRYRVDEESMTLKLGNMMDGFAYAENISIPLIDDTNGVFFDPYYYREYIQPLFNGDYALQRDLEAAQTSVSTLEAKVAALEAKVTELLNLLNKQTLITK